MRDTDTMSATPALQDRVAVVTGAGRGLGAAIAIALARAGSAVALWGRGESALRRTAAAIQAYGAPVMTCPTDIRDSAQIDRALARTHEACGTVDLLVNNAGLGYYKPFLDHSRAELDEIIAVNLTGLMAATQAVLPDMVAGRRGDIVNIASDLGRRTIPDMAPYIAAKHGVVGFSHALRQEVRPAGIRVCVLTPGLIDTDFHGGAAGELGRERALQAADVADLIVTLVARPRDIVVDELSVHAMGQDA